MKQRTLVLLTLVITATLVLAACSPAGPSTEDAGTVLTKAANTAAAQITEQAASQPSATPEPTQAPTETSAPPTATLAATNTAAVTGPTATQAPSITPPSTTDDSASFVADVNYPDNTVVSPGAKFEKIWRIKNTGTTTWTTSYHLVCIDAGKFQCAESTAIPVEVKPGETVEIKVALTAPDTNGTHKAFFRLRNANGAFFKLDQTGDLWIQIVVGTPVTETPDAASATNTPEPTATTGTP